MRDEPELLGRMTDRARKVVRLSAAFSEQFSHNDIEPEDLLDALAHIGGISDVVLAEVGYLRKKAPKVIAGVDRLSSPSERINSIVAEAHEQARLLGHGYVGSEHLLLALANTNAELFTDPAAVRLKVLQILGLAE
jgi:ATP-dependent Clp protease ATP-binding subunit ClpA